MARSTSIAPIVTFAAERHGVLSRTEAARLGLERNAVR